MKLKPSWIESANAPGCPFPLNNLPHGVFSVEDGDLRCGVAIGDRVIDATGLEAAGLLRADPHADVLDAAGWNDFMELGPAAWAAWREALTGMLAEGADEAAQEAIATYSVPLGEATLHLPFTVTEYTDFYAGRHHVTNVGTIIRGAENALPANWLSIPVGYNGRASSVMVSGSELRRPWGQLKAPDAELPRFAPSQRFDFELELGAVVGIASERPVTVGEADAMIFGYVLLNDWSARDIQTWEYQPLGPFQSKATATTISPWIVPAAALEPFRVPTPARERPLLDYLAEPGPMLYDIDLTVSLAPQGKQASIVSRSNYREMYYSSAQQLAHHTSSGCPMRPGDLLGSGTISGPSEESRGSMLELSWSGQKPLVLDSGEERGFLEDGDTVTFTGAARGADYVIGFGECTGTVLPALEDPYAR